MPEMLKDSSVPIIKQTKHDEMCFKTIDNDEEEFDREGLSDDSLDRVSD